MHMNHIKLSILAVTLLAFGSLVTGSKAAVIIDITETAQGMSVRVSGSLNTTGATQVQPQNSFGAFSGFAGNSTSGIIRGNVAGTPATFYQTFSAGIVGDLFPSLPSTAAAGGDYFGPFGLVGFSIAVPVGYVSDTFIDATAEYSGDY